MEGMNWNLPVLALRGLTVFPHMSMSLDVEREVSLRALEKAMEGDQRIFLVTQREIGTEAPEERDLYEVGTVCAIRQILKMSGSTVRILVDGLCRAKLCRLWQTEPYLQANVEELGETEVRQSPRVEALLRRTAILFGAYAELVGGVSDAARAMVLESRDPGALADFIAHNCDFRYHEKQEVLEERDPSQRLKHVNELLARENEVLSLQKEMEGKVRQELERGQREQILRTQIRVMQNELGEEDELEDYRQRIEALPLPEESRKHLLREVDRIARQPYGSAEAAVARNYLDVCLEMPWGVETKERLNVEAARKILERDHFGLEKVKERILESLAVRQMNPNGKAQILCLVGPPGVGKTSIAMSVAKATNRKLARLSLGGVRDEADIRGHRKTYVGAMPGRIIEGLIHSGSMNPLLVLDDTFHVVAYHRPLGFSDPLFQASVSRGEITYEAGAIISRSEALMAGTADYVKLEDSVYRRRFVPLISSGVRLGFLICVDTDGHLQKIPQETWNTVEQILAKQAFIETSRHDKPFETAEDILMHLLDGGFSSALYFSRGWMRCMTASSTSNTSTAGMARSALKLKHPRCAALRLCVTNALPQIRAVISGSTTCRTFGFFIVASRISHMLQ